MVAAIPRKNFATIRRRVRVHALAQKRCDLGCGTIGVKQQCCGKRVCGTCALNLVRARDTVAVGCAHLCQITCPFCRHVRSLTQAKMKTLMRLHCPSHAKTVEVEDFSGEAYPGVLVHKPCQEHGCYACRASIVLVSQPHLVYEMGYEMGILQRRLRTTESQLEQAYETNRNSSRVVHDLENRVLQLQNTVSLLRDTLESTVAQGRPERAVLRYIRLNTTCPMTLAVVEDFLEDDTGRL